jgi:thymidylate kinase
MWCDPTRYRFRLSKGLVRFLSRLVPSPDFTFVLLTDAETIVKRKGEMSVDAANELMEEYRRLPKAERRCFAVDAKQTLDKVAAEIERPIVAYLLERENDRNDFSHH